MATKIDDANIDKIRTRVQNSDPSAPPNGYGFIFEREDGKAYFKNSTGTVLDMTFVPAFGRFRSESYGAYSTGTTSFVDVDPTNGTITLYSGKAHRYKVGWVARGGNGTNTGGILIDAAVDGVRLGGTQGSVLVVVPSANNNQNLSAEVVTNVLSIGSHTFKLQYCAVTTGTARIESASGTSPLVFWVEEMNVSV